jgi:hypothetical protein
MDDYNCMAYERCSAHNAAVVSDGLFDWQHNAALMVMSAMRPTRQTVHAVGRQAHDYINTCRYGDQHLL